MPDSLPALEAERSHILRQISRLGDLRPGSISAVVRRCGKPTCHCAKPSDPGHDPQLRLTRKVNGKTVAESFASPAAFHKAQAEIYEYQRLQKLCADLVDVNERICRLRPNEKQPEKWSAEEKKRLLRSHRAGRHGRARFISAWAETSAAIGPEQARLRPENAPVDRVRYLARFGGVMPVGLGQQRASPGGSKGRRCQA